MRLFLVASLLLLSTACVAPSRIVVTADDRVKSIEDTAADLASADVVVMGELHDSAAVHETHHALLRRLHALRPNMIIAMEMFERDVQGVLLQYLGGLIDEEVFLAKARPWPNYQRDYRPVVEFAKAHGLVVLAANAPRPLARKVSQQGIASVAGEMHVARETTAPEDEYYDAFVTVMGNHLGTQGNGAMQRMYAAQCLKDDTMAETVVDRLRERREAGDHPLVVLICGQMHSDYRRGTVARIQSRMPELAIRVLTSEKVEDVDAGVYNSPRHIADYVVVVEGVKDAPLPPIPDKVLRPSTVEKPVEVVTAKPVDEPNPEGLRPALGLMPDYGAGVAGVKVDSLRPDGAAEKAGIEVGDIVIELGGIAVDSVEAYADALDEQKIGKTIPVRVRRGTGEIVYQVQVSSRPR